MSYPLVPASYGPRSIGPYATPGWQFAPVPGWGGATDFSARDRRVGIGGTTRNDRVLPRYAPTTAGDMFEHLQLQGGQVPSEFILPRAMQIAMASKYPAPPFQPVAVDQIMPRYARDSWDRTQGGYYPLGVDPVPAPETKYGLGEVLIAGTVGLLTGMALTFFWMKKD